jgi:hypothetical protein
MDPITLIATALAAGAALGISDSAASAVKDAFTGLKTLVKKRLDGRPDGKLVLARHEESPGIWRAPLMAELDRAGASHDLDLVRAAEALMYLVDKAGARAGKYVVDVRGAQGVQIGDRNTQHNVFGTPPGGSGSPDTGAAPGLYTEEGTDER